MIVKLFLMVGLMSAGLAGCAKAQIGKQIIDLDNLSYNLDAAHYYAPAIEQEQLDLEDSQPRNPWIFYARDTLRYYNTQTDELYPELISYTQNGEIIKEAVFCGFDFSRLNMATSADGKLVFVKASARMDEADVAALSSTVGEKYGTPCCAEESEEAALVSEWRWETEDEYIQLRLYSASRDLSIHLQVSDDPKQPVKIGEQSPQATVVLYRWQKRYHIPVLICFDMIPMACDRQARESLHAESAEYYTPKIVRPFLITTHFLDSLAQRTDVYSRIEAGFYHRIPGSRVLDETGMGDSVKINAEGCLPYWGFGAWVKNFKDGLSNRQYIIRQMQKGVRFAELMTDKKLCVKGFYGEAEWAEKKKVAGLVFFEQNEQGEILLRDTYKVDYLTIYDRALRFDDRLREELRRSGLVLEKTTAHCISFPGESRIAAYFTDGLLDLFTFIGDPGAGTMTENRFWEAGRLYRVLDYLKEREN